MLKVTIELEGSLLRDLISCSKLYNTTIEKTIVILLNEANDCSICGISD